MLFILSYLLPSVAITLSMSHAALQCSALDVTDKTEAPLGIDPNAVRTYFKHPNDGDQDFIANTACLSGRPTGYACANGYCKSKCGDSGKWCWLARDRGPGDWFTCTENEHCVPSNMPHNAGCDKREGSCGC